ncbi:isoleucine--tRNA ligase [Peptoniphilus sp. oral taxon 386]|uniref:isoleucine--tRNA ligase n=1 Tax=Peptoniphilus sp. oral taxon 386 TaxID=652713 RepID=UPI0001DA9B92|nr:isoleucine--tRNA ligase [Peptoniphilus sp. oral taxon 386]EFI42149.1 isoleucine--tRNA ligase [Peptoniphilus sp. oral taxon 386 str. F0131]
MKVFKTLSKESVKEREESIAKYWEDIDLLHRSVETRAGNEPYIFFEGPPTANGRPGIHHVMARTLKDLTCRYKTMNGYQVKRKAGWDTHGLPVEIEVEKRLDLHNKQDIEKYGIADFNKMCKESVFEYEREWRTLTKRMAYLIDLDHPYITLENDYIESVWYILNKMFEDGLIYEGHKILPYCPRCGTGLASHEVAQGYEEIKTETVIAKFKLANKDEYFLAWTTTPWTLPSNVALTVNADVDYIKVKYEDVIYYVAKDLASKIFDKEYEILETMKGKELEFVEYEQLIPFLTTNKKAFFVTCADYVTTEDGTGIVHTAPAFGEDDYQTGRRYDLPVLNPVDEEGKFTETPWKGQFVMDADHEVIHYLYDNDKLFKKQKFLHNYPHCWRCHTPLIYYAHPSWYIEVTKFKDKLIENNNDVNWFPEFVGEKRFGNWLENLNDWAISRSRYWGTPLPLWRCECGHVESVGSRKELVEKAVEDIDETVELHRPYVDDIHLTCPHCGKSMTREKDVIDVWFDSGAMPFAQWHYPFEHKDDFNELFPANFICEGIDQTRGWFYSLLAISTYMTGVTPYKNVLVNDLILDKFGKKMSKSKGNTVQPFELFDKYGADTVRWYLMYVSPPWAPTKFDEDGLREAESKFFRSLRNIYNFFSLYANTDEIDPREFKVSYENRDEIDKWLLSKYNNLLLNVKADMEVFELTRVVRNIQDFVIEDFSNWYIRRNRRRFWKTEIDDDKKAVYNTTYEVMLGITKVIAPFVPFIAEELFKSLTENESVHLEMYPLADESLIDTKLEEKMDLVRSLVALGRASREEVKIKVRQPLSKVIIDGKYKEIIGDLTDLIKEELNVKEVVFEEDLSVFMNYELKPNFKVAGSILGAKIKEFGNVLKSIEPKKFVSDLKNGAVNMVLNGEDTEILEDYVLITIKSKEGFDVMMENNLFVILDTELTKELVEEGYVREFISKIQQLRKSEDLDVLDNIVISYEADDEVVEAITNYTEFIKAETLAQDIKREGFEGESVDLNGHDSKIKIEKLN